MFRRFESSIGTDVSKKHSALKTSATNYELTRRNIQENAKFQQIKL
jgi:hypothetical protein